MTIIGVSAAFAIIVPFFLVTVVVDSVKNRPVIMYAQSRSRSSSSAANSSSSSSRVFSKLAWKQMPLAENQMSPKQDVWSDIPMVKDQSVTVELTRDQKIAVNKYIKTDIETYKVNRDVTEVPLQQSHWVLPDQSIIVVGRVDDYLAPRWVFRLSSTGGLLADIGKKMEQAQIFSFKGYADGIAYFHGAFGDGGGVSETMYAVELQTNEVTKIQNIEKYMAPSIKVDPTFLPSYCIGSPTEDELHKIADKFLTAIENIVIGQICTTGNVTILPYTMPSVGQYGVAVSFKNGDAYLQKSLERSKFPPVFAKDSSSNNIVLLISNEKTLGSTYIYSQEYFFVDSFSEDANIHRNDAFYKSQEMPSFCQSHACIEGMFEAPIK